MFCSGLSLSENCRRLQTAAKSIALFYTGIALLFLLANIFGLFILMGIHETAMESNIQYEQWNADSESINSNKECYFLTCMLKGKLSLKKADVVTVLTITLIYFVLELFVARVLYNGVKKLHLSKLQLWCDIRLAILAVNALAVCPNLFNWAEQRNYGILNIFIITLAMLGLFIVKRLMAVTDEFKLQFPESMGSDCSPKASKASHIVDTFVI